MGAVGEIRKGGEVFTETAGGRGAGRTLPRSQPQRILRGLYFVTWGKKELSVWGEEGLVGCRTRYPGVGGLPQTLSPRGRPLQRASVQEDSKGEGGLGLGSEGCTGVCWPLASRGARLGERGRAGLRPSEPEWPRAALLCLGPPHLTLLSEPPGHQAQSWAGWGAPCPPAGWWGGGWVGGSGRCGWVDKDSGGGSL